MDYGFIKNEKIAEVETLKRNGDFKALKLRIGRESFKTDIQAYNEVIKRSWSRYYCNV